MGHERVYSMFCVYVWKTSNDTPAATWHKRLGWRTRFICSVFVVLTTRPSFQQPTRRWFIALGGLVHNIPEYTPTHFLGLSKANLMSNSSTVCRYTKATERCPSSYRPQTVSARAHQGNWQPQFPWILISLSWTRISEWSNTNWWNCVCGCQFPWCALTLTLPPPAYTHIPSYSRLRIVHKNACSVNDLITFVSDESFGNFDIG
jgi:hypothetical protein